MLYNRQSSFKLSLLRKHLVIGQPKKAHNFSAFLWSLHGSLISTGQIFVTTRVVHLPKRTETSLITDRIGADHITESDKAVRVVHSCNSWFQRLPSYRMHTINKNGIHATLKQSKECNHCYTRPVVQNPYILL